MLLAVVFAAGCVTLPAAITEKGLLVKMDANPKEVFSNGITTISVDVENQDTKTLKDVNVDIFETGSLDKVGTCKNQYEKLDPKDFKTFACNLKAKKVERVVDNTVWARAKYGSTLSAVQTFDIISQSEFETRKKTGKFVESQKSFSFRDNNLELTMELSDSPIVDKQGEEFVSFRIKNIGNGFIEKLSKADIQIGSSKVGFIDRTTCSSNDIYIIGREFPRFSCVLNLRGDVPNFLPVKIQVEINYQYEIRDSIDVRILKETAPSPATSTTTTAPAITSGEWSREKQTCNEYCSTTGRTCIEAKTTGLGFKVGERCSGSDSRDCDYTTGSQVCCVCRATTPTPVATSTSTTTPVVLPIHKGLVFVTSTVYHGDLGGLSGVDAKCQQRADKAGLAGKWIAWLSDSKADARDRISDTQYKDLKGNVIANDKADLTDGDIQNLIKIDESGNDITGQNRVWTGTKNDGTKAENCRDWSWSTTDAQSGGACGDTNSKTLWTQVCIAGCSSEYRLYCFEITPTPTS